MGLMLDRIEYKGVTLEVWEQSIRLTPGSGLVFWYGRAVRAKDIEWVKQAIDAGRAAMASDMRDLKTQKTKLMEEANGS
jgi:hypothetical protein